LIPVSVTAPQFGDDPQPLLDLARDPLQFRGIFVFDHLVPLGDPQRPILEAAATLGALAATTSTRLGSLVLRATMRPPEINAGIAASLAAIAPGRVTLAFGAGDKLTADEAKRYGLEAPGLAERLRLLAATIRAVRETAPSVEIWVGGRHRAIRALAAELADGWNCWGAEPEEFAAEAAEVRTAARRPLWVSWAGTVRVADEEPESIRARLGRLAETADELVLSLVPNRRPTWEWLSGLLTPGVP